MLKGSKFARLTRLVWSNQVSEKIPILRGVRQVDLISPKLFTATIPGIFENVQLEKKGINIDGERVSDLQFVNDVALTTEGVKDTEQQLNKVNEESSNISLKIHKGKTNFMTNIDTTDIQIDGTELEKVTIEKVTNYKYLGQTTAMENRPRQ